MLCITLGCWFWAPQHVPGRITTLGFSVNRHQTWWIRICRTSSSRTRNHRRVHQSESGHSKVTKWQPRGYSLPLSCRSLALRSWMGRHSLTARQSCHEDEASWLSSSEMTKFWIIHPIRRKPTLPAQDAQALILEKLMVEALLPKAQALHRSRVEKCYHTPAQDTTEKFWINPWSNRNVGQMLLRMKQDLKQHYHQRAQFIINRKGMCQLHQVIEWNNTKLTRSTPETL